MNARLQENDVNQHNFITFGTHPSAGPRALGNHKLRCTRDRDVVLVLVRLQGPSRILPNLLLSLEMSKLPPPANTFLNTCLCFMKWTSLPSPGWREELHLTLERKSICRPRPGYTRRRGGKASASRITSRKLLSASEEQHVPVSWYRCQRSSWSLWLHELPAQLTGLCVCNNNFIIFFNLNAYQTQYS